MIEDVEVARDDLVLEDTARGNVNVRASVGNNDNSTLEDNICSESNISSDSQMVQLQDVGRVLEARHEAVDLLEVIAQLDEGDSVEHALGVDRQLAVDQ